MFDKADQYATPSPEKHRQNEKVRGAFRLTDTPPNKGSTQIANKAYKYIFKRPLYIAIAGVPVAYGIFYWSGRFTEMIYNNMFNNKEQEWSHYRQRLRAAIDANEEGGD